MGDVTAAVEPLPTRIETPFGTIDFDPTTADWTQNSLISAKIMCAARNGNLKAIFDGAWQSFVTNCEAGRVAPTELNAPHVPPSWVPSKSADGSYTIAQSGPPAWTRPPLPVDRLTKPTIPAMSIDIGAYADGGAGVWFAVGPKDSYPVGKKTPPGTRSADGVVGIFQRVGTAVGPGWYERLA